MADVYRTEVPGGVLYVPIAASATSVLVIGVPTRKIVVLTASLVASAAVSVKFQTSTGSFDITGPYYCAQNGGFVLPFSAGGWFATDRGDNLILNLSPSIAVGGSLSYILV